MFEAIMNYTFLQHALLAAVLASVACGIMGTIIIEKNLLMSSGGIAHTAFGGVGLGYFLGIDPMLPATVFSTGAALAIVDLNRREGINADNLIGMFWPLGMALGILFIAFTPGYPPDVNSYLFGDILTVASGDLKNMLVLDLIIIGVVWLCYDQLLLWLFDEDFATAIGMKNRFMEYVIYFLIGLTVVVIIRVVGIILILALLSAPPTIARMFSYNFKRIMLLSMLLGLVFCLCGLACSWYLELATGASIVIIAVLGWLLSLPLSRLSSARRHGTAQEEQGDLGL
ncbi:MAG: metal ABC transporter permease [Syntrophomonadaceae bacterium]|nr:metal ABC transporter permease [Syntrophomonadaceae bacterium]